MMSNSTLPLGFFHSNKAALSLCDGVVFYFHISFAVEFLLVGATCSGDEVHQPDIIAAYLYLIIWMDDEFR